MKAILREVALILMGIVCWACAAAAAYGCGTPAAESAAKCQDELNQKLAECLARATVCVEDGCEEKIRTECHKQGNEACK